MTHNWTYKKLGEVAKFTSGFTPNSAELFPKGKYPYFKVSDMNTMGNEVVLTKTTLYVADSKKCYPKGAIVFPKNGAAISTNKKRILGQDSIVDLNTGVAIFDSDIDIHYAHYWFIRIDFRDYVRGGALPTLDIKGLQNALIPIPSLSEQESIVAELDAINHLIDLHEQQLREYDRLAQSLFYSTFGDPTTNHKGWKVKKLSYVVSEECKMSYGIVQPGDDIEDGVPVVRPIDFKDSEYIQRKGLKKTLPSISDSYKRTILRGDEILICVRGTTGTMGLATPELKGCNVTRGIVPLYFRNEMNKWFMYKYLKSNFAQNIIAENTYGATLKQINISALRSIPIMCPPLSLQQSFAAQIEAIEQQKALIRRSLEHTRTLLAARMQYYFE